MAVLQLSTGAALIRVTTAVGERILEARAESGCTALQLQALRVARGGPTMTDLGGYLAVPKSSATSVVDQLVAAGLATRELDPDDRRRQRVWPTAKGNAVLDRFDATMRTRVHELVDGLTGRQQKQLLALLGGIPDPNGLLPLG